MRRPSFPAWLLLAFAAFLLSGCRATQVAHDGINFRQALQDMYTDQAVDNLVRARTGRVFVQLEYKDLLVQVTDQYFGELSSNQQTTSNEGLTLKTIGAFVPRVFQNVLNIHGSAQRQGQMSFHADPVTSQNDIYDAYLAFASSPQLLAVTDCPPPPGAAHVQRKYEGRYYWVPCQAAGLFQQLVLKTTMMRGPDAMPPGSYDVKIIDVLEPTADDDDPELFHAVLRFNKPVPNGKGSLLITLENGRKVRLPLARVDSSPDDPDKELKLGEMTPFLEVRWKVSRDQVTIDNIRGAKAQVYSDDYPPVIAGENVTEEIRHDLNRVRASVSPMLSPVP